MSPHRRVSVAISGGVDSSVAAALLLQEGHEVLGITMITHGEQPVDARNVAAALGIELVEIDVAAQFEARVVLPFARAYQRGETPNPCVICNPTVKLALLLEQARRRGAGTLATGHYARIIQTGGATRLGRGADRRKDQSYFLYRLSRQQLGSVSFPLGEMTKTEVRARARELALPLAERESQEICFVPDKYATLVEQLVGGGKPGRFVDRSGKVWGTHDGIHRFTIGQRKGLGIAAPHAMYVLDIDPETGDIEVGAEQELEVCEVALRDVVWAEGVPDPSEWLGVQQRYRQRPVRGRVEAGGRRVVFAEPQGRGAPGQSVVLYRDDIVVGGGLITRGGEDG